MDSQSSALLLSIVLICLNTRNIHHPNFSFLQNIPFFPLPLPLYSSVTKCRFLCNQFFPVFLMLYQLVLIFVPSLDSYEIGSPPPLPSLYLSSFSTPPLFPGTLAVPARSSPRSLCLSTPSLQEVYFISNPLLPPPSLYLSSFSSPPLSP